MISRILFEDLKYKYHLPNLTSILTSELFAIEKVLDTIIEDSCELMNYIVASDSLNALQNMQKNARVTGIKKNIHEATLSNKTVVFM